MRDLRLMAVVMAAGLCGASTSQGILRISKSELMGLELDFESREFRTLPSDYCLKERCVLRSEAALAFEQMALAAARDGIRLRVLSATRSFSDQKRIWEAKWRARTGEPKSRAMDILKYSSMPGTSRHHWGTDLDINSLEPSYFKSGRGLEEYLWLNENASRFGFFQAYTLSASTEAGGYQEEPWHWSYAPLSNKMLRAYLIWVDYDDLPYFQGVEVAEELQIFDRFVRGVSYMAL